MSNRPAVRPISSPPRDIEELSPQDAEVVRGGQGSQLASVTDLVIDPFNSRQPVPRRWTAEHVEEVST
jgi:hypothetical protein